jgi:adenosine kinase
MNFSGIFSDYIIPDKIHMLNVCFPIGHLEEKRGGTGGNIAYNLALLGERCTLLASVGKDFGLYKNQLEQIGINLDGIRTIHDELTAGAYITTDKQASQIIGFHAAAMNYSCEYNFAGLDPKNDLAIIAPTNTDDMVKHAKLYAEKKLRYIFDPGQQITALSGDALVTGIRDAMILISNDYELELIKQLTKLTLEQLLDLTPVIITTLGKDGSKIIRRGNKVSLIPPMPIDRLENPTGAGDSYRAGLIKGILTGLTLEQSATIGSACAAFCVEKYGTQEHYYDQGLLEQKYQSVTGEKLPLRFTTLIPRP